MNRPSQQFVFGALMLAAALPASADRLTDTETAYRAHKAAIVRGDLQAAMIGLSDDVIYVAGPACLPSKPDMADEQTAKLYRTPPPAAR